MSSIYRELKVYYKSIAGDWRDVDTATEEELTFYTLSATPVELKVDLEDEATVGSLQTSENNIQWRYGNQQIQIGRQFKHAYDKAGKDTIQLYVATNEGTVVSKGDQNGLPTPVVVTIKNILATNVYVNASGDDVETVSEELTPEEIAAGVVPTTISIAKLTAGNPSMPINIYTSHTWQLYSDTQTPNKVNLYADQAGMRLVTSTFGPVRATESAPLKTTSYNDNKYAQFQKTWRFCTDENAQNPVDFIYTDTTRIYARINDDKTDWEFCDETAPRAEFVGTSGHSTIYYVDDSYSWLYNDDDRHGYRLMAQLDTTNWPDSQSGELFDTAEFISAPDRVNTPQMYQATYDRLWVKVEPSVPSQLVITSSGINTPNFIISRDKFINTHIPFVVSFADSEGFIIKSVENAQGRTNSIQPYGNWDNFDTADAEDDVYYIGLSSAESHDSAKVSFSANQTLSAINPHSSVTSVFTCEETINSARVAAYYKSSVHGVLTGQSAEFTLHPETGKYTFFKHGESIDYGETINSYILQENINQHSKITTMLDAIFGNYNDLPESIGKILYEKIENFVDNNADYDYCNVNALYGLAESVQKDLINYNFSYPGGVRRIMDAMSVGVRRLIGDRDKYDDDFTDYAKYTDTSVKFGRNIGDELDIDTYIVTAGEPIVAKEIYGSNLFKVLPSYISGDENDEHYTTEQGLNGLSAYPLSSYQPNWNWGLTYPESNIFSDYYTFHEYVSNETYPLSSFDQTSGIINWEATKRLGSAYSVIPEGVESYDEWYGDDGIVETSLEYALRNGLKLLK